MKPCETLVPEQGPPMDGKKHVGVTVRTLNNMIKRRMAACFASHGPDEFTMMQGWIIRYVYESGERDVFQKDVEKRFSVSRSTATGILQQMEKNGYLYRVSVERDARLKKLVLTEKAIRYHFHILEEVQAMEECLMRDISQEELELFFAVAEKMQENIRKDSVC